MAGSKVPKGFRIVDILSDTPDVKEDSPKYKDFTPFVTPKTVCSAVSGKRSKRFAEGHSHQRINKRSTKCITKGVGQGASAFQEFRPFQNVVPRNQTNDASCPSTSRAEPVGNLVKDCQCSNTMSHSNDTCSSRNTNRCFLQRMESSHQLRRQTDITYRYHRQTSMVPLHRYQPRSPPYLQQPTMSDSSSCRLSHDVNSASNIPTMHRNIPTMHPNESAMQRSVPSMEHSVVREQVYCRAQETDICTLCTKAKDELSANLHARLRWVMYVEHSICNCDSKLLVFHESLKKMKRRLEVFEQVFEAPRMYVLAVLEILRRKSFSVQFLEWGRNVSISASEARSEEIEKRNKFSQVFGNHFLHSLFSGLDDSPSMFAEKPPSIFDERLPDIDVNDIQILQREVPELLIELSLGDPLEQSFYVRERLSQTNLSKLVDPKSNPTLEETLKLRELTGINAMSKMTVSQLHKEISQEEMPIGMTRKPIDWQLGNTEEGMTEGDFQPSSLKTLPSELEGLQSSQSSEISDSLFRSAEGLDDKGDFGGDFQVEVVGVLELSECATPQPEGNAKSELVDSYETIALQKTEALEVSRKRTSTDITVTEEIAPGIRSLNESPYVTVASPKLRQSAFVVVESIKNLHTEFYEVRNTVRLFKNDFLEVIGNTSNEIKIKLSSFATEFIAAVERNRLLKEELEKQKTSTFEYVSQMTAEFENKKDGLEKEYRNHFRKMEKDLGHQHEEEITLIQRAHEAEINSLRSNLSGNENRLEEKEVGLQNALTEIDKLMERYRIRDEEVENMLKEWKIQELGLNETISNLKSEKETQDEYKRETMKELELLKMNKNQLESDSQMNFNIALNKVKREKEGMIKELQNEIDILKNELKLRDQKLKQTISENLHYKDINATIMSRIETLEKDKEVIERNCEAQVAKEKENCDRMILSMKDEIEKEKLEMSENFKKEKEEFEMKWQLEAQENLDRTISSMKENMEKEKLELLENFSKEKIDLEEKWKSEVCDKQKEFENNLSEMGDKFETEKYELLRNFEEVKSNLKADFGAEKFKLIDDCKKQKLSLREDFEREKATLKEGFEKEKCEIILTYDLEKQKLTDELEKQQSLSKTSSIEEGIDALEWDKLLQKLRDLEAENKELQDETESKEKAAPVEDLESYKKLLMEKEEENCSLKEKLGQLKIVTGDSSTVEGQERICFKQFKVNDLVLLCYDEQRSNYMVLTSEDTKYFLHPDSKSALKLITTDVASKTREWLLAYVTEQEYCIAKKVQNRFKLPVGTYFYRIHAKPWDS